MFKTSHKFWKQLFCSQPFTSDKFYYKTSKNNEIWAQSTKTLKIPSSSCLSFITYALMNLFYHNFLLENKFPKLTLLLIFEKKKHVLRVLQIMYRICFKDLICFFFFISCKMLRGHVFVFNINYFTKQKYVQIMFSYFFLLN